MNLVGLCIILGVVIGLFGQLLMINKSSSLSNEQLNILGGVPKESSIGFFLLIALAVSQNYLNIGSLIYILAVLFVLSPSYDLYRLNSFISNSQLIDKKFYVAAITLKQMGYSICFLGVSLWVLKT